MTWEPHPLWAKSKLFFQYCFESPRDDPRFGLWAAMALELLARSAIATISPTLLAEADRDQRNVLFALQTKNMKTQSKSIGISQVLAMCGDLVENFTPDDIKVALSIINRRNEELHTGESSFSAFPVDLWISGFYRCCSILNESMGYSLSDLFGEDESKTAATVMSELEKEVTATVNATMAAHRKVFEAKSDIDKKNSFDRAYEECERLSFQRHHKVKCPACDGPATVQGTVFGPEHVREAEGKIVIRQAVLPNLFECNNCGLKLSGFASLRVAKLGAQYTRTTTYSIADYYGMVDPSDDEAVERFFRQQVDDFHHEYDND